MATVSSNQLLFHVSGKGRHVLDDDDIFSIDLSWGTGKTLTFANGSSLDIASGATLDVSAGTLTLAANQISGDKVEGGTIAATTITALTTNAITASSNIDIGAYDFRAQNLTADALSTPNQVLYTGTSGLLSCEAGFEYVPGTNTLTVGNLTVSGTTTTIESTVVTIKDPVFEIGQSSSDDNLDRGIKMKWHNGSAPKIAFMGYDDSAGKFVMIADATDSSSVFSGSAATLVASLQGNVTGDVTGNADTATILATARTIGGTSFDGSANIAVALAASATALASARTIGGTSFDGTANIVPATITVADTTNTSCSVGLWESATGDLAPKSDGGLTYNAGTGMLTATGLTGPLTGNASGTAATVTGAAQTAITSLGTLTALTVDDIVFNGKVITMTGDTGDTVTVTAAAAALFTIATTDAAGADGHIVLDADGDVKLDPASGITRFMLAGDADDLCTLTVAASGATTLATADSDGTAGHLTLDVDGNITIDADGGTITFSDAGSSFGTITSAGWTGAVVGAVTGNADTATALAAGRTIGMTGDVVWTSASFDGSGNVTGSAVIQADAVELSMMADNSVDSDQYVDGSIDLVHMSADSVDSDQYVDGSIDLIHMSANSVDSDQYVNASIDVAHMSANSVDSAQYVDGSIDLVHMSANSVDSAQYVDASIDTAHIANDQITNALMADNSVDSDQYVDGSIDLVHMSANSVDSAQYVDASIDVAHMSANSVDSAQYVDGSIDLVHMSADSVDSDQYVDGSIDYAHIQNVAANSLLVRNSGVGAGVLTEKVLATTQILIGNGTGFTATAISGNATMTNAGVLSLSGTTDHGVLEFIGSGYAARLKHVDYQQRYDSAPDNETPDREPSVKKFGVIESDGGSDVLIRTAKLDAGVARPLWFFMPEAVNSKMAMQYRGQITCKIRFTGAQDAARGAWAYMEPSGGGVTTIDPAGASVVGWRIIVGQVIDPPSDGDGTNEGTVELIPGLPADYIT